ncbi:MAG: sigma-70 family RNA polymerase sigma factor [Phycisphaerales bacterium]|nr:MAG: sigma-70 family RNA polymerase sigma factor [Phycisphaerales bacterium]
MRSVTGPSKDFKHRVATVARLFYDHGDFIRNTIRTYVQSEDQVDDLVQALFISLVRSSVPEGIQNVERYLYKTIINDIADVERRERKYRYAMRIYAELSANPTEQKTPPELLIQVEQIRKVSQLIEHRLPPSEAKAVTLRYRKQNSVKEAAENMGVDGMTLRGYVYQGLCRIRRLLRNIGVELAD